MSQATVKPLLVPTQDKIKDCMWGQNFTQTNHADQSAVKVVKAKLSVTDTKSVLFS